MGDKNTPYETVGPEHTNGLQYLVDATPFVGLDYEGDTKPYVGVERRVHYTFPGSTFQKAVDERMEQVTGFPAAHFSEWIILRLPAGRTIHPHYDVIPEFVAPHATVSVFLSVPDEEEEEDVGAVVFPWTARGDSIQVRPQPGLAVVHHNLVPQKSVREFYAQHGWMPGKKGVVYVAQRYILQTPVSPLRRWILPIYTALTHGQIPSPLLQWHTFCVDRFGIDAGNAYWDQSLVALPALLLLVIVYGVGQYVQAHLRRNAPPTKVAKPTPTKPKKKKKQ